MESTSASLLARLKEPQDEQAWQRFVDLYVPVLYAWTYRLGLRGEEAADLIQEILLLLVQQLPLLEYDPQRSFRAWLRTVTLNKWRESRRRVHSPDNDVPLPEDLAEQEDAPFWEIELRQHLMGRAIQIMESDFQPTTWQAFWACVVEGEPAEKVAQQLHLSTNAVHLAKFRVLRRLRQELAGLLN